MESRETYIAAAKEIRRWAPTQSHAVRRAMMEIANLYDGGHPIDNHNMLFVATPVTYEGELLGYAEMTIQGDGSNEAGVPIVRVSSEFNQLEEGS